MMEIISPIDGDMMHARDGVTEGKGLWIPVRIAAAAGSEIYVNGIRAVEKDGGYVAEVFLKEYQQQLQARDEKTGETDAVTIYLLPNFAGGYRLSIDDNIWFLRDIHEQDAVYTSIFDNPYLAMLKEIHDLYGTKVHLNLFYETDRFNLSMLSDRFRDEWSAQSSWIRLSFHALGEFPDMPYKDAGYDQVKRDCDLVTTEIRRFAGEAVMGPMTTLHWGEAKVEGVRALRDAGYKGVLGYFNVDDDLPAVSLYLDVEQRRHIKKRFVWKDNREDMVFVRTSIVIDKTDLKDIRRHLDGHAAKGGLPPYADLLVHEQYFYPFYEVYQPDFRERLLESVAWARERGYTPKFLEECIL